MICKTNITIRYIRFILVLLILLDHHDHLYDLNHSYVSYILGCADPNIPNALLCVKFLGVIDVLGYLMDIMEVDGLPLHLESA